MGGDTKEVRIAEAPDTSVEVRRGDTAFLVNELASIGNEKDVKGSPEDSEAALSEELSGEKGKVIAFDIQQMALDHTKEKLEKELARKEKALAEAAALLVLRKKQMRFGERTERTNDH